MLTTATILIDIFQVYVIFAVDSPNIFQETFADWMPVLMSNQWHKSTEAIIHLSWTVLHARCTSGLSSVFPISQGDAEELDR